MKFTHYLLTVFALLGSSLVTPVWSATTKPLTVNELAAKPDTHIGKVTIIGMVTAANSGKGFTLVDTINCGSDCGGNCHINKIPFVWAGAAPVLKDVVLVQGTLSKTAKGYTFAAENVTKQ